MMRKIWDGKDMKMRSQAALVLQVNRIKRVAICVKLIKK